MTKRARSAWQWFLSASLWLASIGLMVASSGLDGAYLAKLMPDRFAWLGLLLNTMADITSELGMYWYGRLQQGNKAKRVRSKWVLVGQVLLVVYSWLFSWRQLVPRMRQVDPEAAKVMAPLAAAFIPLALIVVGYIQSLLAGKIEDAKPANVPAKSEPVGTPIDKPAPIPQGRRADLSKEQRMEQVLAAMSADSPPTQAELAEQFDVSRSTIGNDIAELREVGKLNGRH